MITDDANPFSKPAVQRTNSKVSGALIWTMVVLGMFFLAGLFALWSIGQKHLIQANSLRSAWETATNDLAKAGASVARLQFTNADLVSRVMALEKEKEMTLQMARGLEDQMRAELESKDVTISKLQGKLTVNILDRILFDSGEAVVKADGEAILQKIASIPKQHPDLKIHVIGHTDNVPIRPSARPRFSSNWELSTERALAAVRFLTERAGVAPQNLGAVGYGEFRPIADNSTMEGRARNRRIAITMLPDELVGIDTPALTHP